MRRRLLVAALLTAAPAAAGAQERTPRLAVSPIVAWPTASWALYGGTGVGASGAARFAARGVPVEVAATFLRFPATTRERPLGGTSSIPLYISTGSSLWMVTAGPSLRVERGRLALALTAAAGVAQYANTSALRTVGDSARYERSASFGGLAGVVRGEGAGALRVGKRAAPVWLEAAGGWTGATRTDFVRETNITVGVISGAYLAPTPTALTWIGGRVGVVIGRRR